MVSFDIRGPTPVTAGMYTRRSPRNCMARPCSDKLVLGMPGQADAPPTDGGPQTVWRPPGQATGPPRSGAGMGVGTLRGAGDLKIKHFLVFILFFGFRCLVVGFMALWLCGFMLLSYGFMALSLYGWVD